MIGKDLQSDDDAGSGGLCHPRRVAAGGERSCAIDASQRLWCWGRDARGGENSTNAPALIAGLSHVTDVALGSAHTCALSDGHVLCWGDNMLGQLGSGDGDDRATPHAVAGIDDAIAIAARLQFTCVLRAGDVITCWGDNSAGQLGDAASGMFSRDPIDVSGLDDGATQVAVGEQHACAIDRNAHVHCWGGNSFGQLGDGTLEPSTRPNTVGLQAETLCAGLDHTCALTSAGEVRCWGENSVAQLGDGTQDGVLGSGMAIGRSSPVLVGGVPSAIGVACGGMMSCALRGGDGVACWGANGFGMLARGGSMQDVAPMAQQASLLDHTVSQLALGTDHACALYADMTLVCWGNNHYGQLGRGSRDPSADDDPESMQPMPVSGQGCE